MEEMRDEMEVYNEAEEDDEDEIGAAGMHVEGDDDVVAPIEEETE